MPIGGAFLAVVAVMGEQIRDSIGSGLRMVAVRKRLLRVMSAVFALDVHGADSMLVVPLDVVILAV